MNWSPRVKPIKIRRLYRFARLGIYNNVLLHDIGGELYDRCTDIVTVADVYREGYVPCPKCKTKVERKIDPLFSKNEGGTRENWFRCQHCDKRLLWRDCRLSLRETPRCFSCKSLLSKTGSMQCSCGKSWTQESYKRSVRTRVRLPCPYCHNLVRRPDPIPASRTIRYRQSEPELKCPKCQEKAIHVSGNIACTVCNYKRRWKDYRKSLKKKDERLDCPKCGHVFRWQEWRKSTQTLRTGNPKPARDFIQNWKRCRTPQQRMIQIDTLLQTLHGRGPLAPLFIDSGERPIRKMLDDLAS